MTKRNLTIAADEAAKRRGNPQRPPVSKWERQDEDVRLMMRFKSGDESAFEELVHRNTGRIHGLVYRFLGRGSHVEDITQEVFLRIHRTAPRYEPAAKFSTWLYRIVANLCFNVMRSRRKGGMRQLDAIDGQDGDLIFRSLPDNRHGNPHDPMDSAELRKTVSAAVDSLPDNQKVAIVLNKFEGKSYDEIADVLGCSAMAVKSLLRRARQSLRETLASRLGGE